jgi:acyl-CoA synthetase (AMP-forming)/AMP-acid ligase II
MRGLMHDWPLLIHTILDHAADWHGSREIVSRTVEGPMHRYCYFDLNRRARKLASAVAKHLDVSLGDVVATMAWNGYRHVEIWYGLMSLGGVVHTLNPRLFADQLVYIVNHAEDQWLFVDLSFLPVLESIQERLPTVRGYIVMTDEAHMPSSTTLDNMICYESLISDGDPDFPWPRFDENTACGMCYSSGTTGNPKGVVYSHRSNVLHALMASSGDVLGFSSRDTILPVVPMFHANAWSQIFAGPLSGTKLVLPGAKLDGASLYELLDSERVTCTAAVPTVWLSLLDYLEKNPRLRLEHLKRVVIGGSACPEAMMRVFVEQYGVDVVHGWGMTEMSPVGSIGTPKGGTEHLSDTERWKLKLKQGRPLYGVEMKITDERGRTLPRDGTTFGRLKVKGPAVAVAYFKGEGAAAFDFEGWLDTGDVATIDEHGYMQIIDRAKDVIKSGGEWISSIDLENLALSCPGVAEAAAIGLPHPKWDERPLLVVVAKTGTQITREEVLAHFRGKVAKWWIPDDVLFVDAIPHTATGKISKLTLREQLSGYSFAPAQPKSDARTIT